MKYVVYVQDGYMPIRDKEKNIVFPENSVFKTYEKELEDIRKNQYVLLQHDVEEALRNDGREEAWGLAQKIVGIDEDAYSVPQLDSIFGSHNPCIIIDDNSYYGARSKVVEWEKKSQRFRVGDIVVLNDAHPLRGVVTNYEVDICDEACYAILFEDGTHGVFGNDDLLETGKSVDLSDVFKKLKGGK